jgi:hypothetical protein
MAPLLQSIVSGLTLIPRTLQTDIQTLILDGNPITGLEKDVFLSSGLMNLQKISLIDCQIS